MQQIKQQQEHKINLYWDYNDELSEEDILKIITEEDGLNDVENDIYDRNMEYIHELEEEYLSKFAEEEREEIRDNIIIDLNIEDLIKNSSINLRLELGSNEDGVYIPDIKHSSTIKYFKKVFRGKYKKEDFDKEVLNMMGSDYGILTFYFRVRGKDILSLREQFLSGKIKLRAGLEFGFFNSWSGCGSLLEIPLLKPITLNVKDWRVKDAKEMILNELEGESSKYYYLKLIQDSKKYGIKEVYGLGGFQEF